MIFAVYVFCGDTCGNQEVYGPEGYVEANSIEEVEKVFPHGAFCGYIVKPVYITDLKLLRKQIDDRIDRKYYR